MKRLLLEKIITSMLFALPAIFYHLILKPAIAIEIPKEDFESCLAPYYDFHRHKA